MGLKMTNMESLYQGFIDYFKNNQEKINYFLVVLNNTIEDCWEYECNSKIFDDTITYKDKTLKYDNIKINYNYFYNSNDDIRFNNKIIIKVNNDTIYKTQDETSELFIELLAMIERAEERAKGE